MSQYGNIGQLNIEINANAELAVQGLEKLSNAMKNLTFGDVSGLKNFTKELRKLSKVQLNDNLASTLKNLQKEISGLNFEVGGLTDFVSSIKKLGNKSVDNAISKIPLLSNAMSQMFRQLSSAPHIRTDIINMTNALANFTSKSIKVSNASSKISKGMDKIGKSAKKNKGLIEQFFAGFNAGNFAGNFTANIIAPLIREFAKGIKDGMEESLEYASDLVETQNVLERTFGNNIDKVNEFSKTALQMYGMNELESKKMIGTFQAMGTALGEAKERMADVSTSLGALVGDYASFFNMNVADVANDFTAIFTGQTKAMRKYGIDLTNAQLQDFADSQGWNVQVKSLNQYNKAIIRYNYLVSRSQDILGDFQRTQGSYANQVKLLDQQFRELFGTLGQIGTAVLTPILQVLNEIVSKIRQFAEQLVSFLGINNFIDISGGAVDGLEDMSDGMEDVEDSANGASKAVKKLKTYSVGIDELNVLKPNEDTSKSSAGVGAGELGAGWDTDWWDKLEKGKKDFTDFSELIQNIYNTLKPTIDAFKEFYSNVLEPIGKVAFDGLISLYEDFLKPIANFTFGGALPFLFNTLADIGKMIDWATITSGLKNLIQVLGKATTGIGKGLIDFFKSIAPVLKPAIATTINLIAKAFELLAKTLNKIPTKVFELIGRGLGVIMTYKAVKGVLTNISNGFLDMSKNMVNFVNNSGMWEQFPALAGHLTDIASGFNTVGMAIQSITGAISIISAIAMAIYQLSDYLNGISTEKFDKELGTVGLSVEKINGMLEKTQELSQLKIEWENGNGEAQKHAEYIKHIADEYFKLADAENLTSQEQEMLKFYAGELVELVPDLSGKIDTLTGAYTGTKNSIIDVINAQIELAKSEAVKEYITETTKNVLEQQKAYDDLLKKQKEYQDTLMAESGKGRMSEITGFEIHTQAYNEAQQNLSRVNGEIKNVSESLKNSKEDLNYWVEELTKLNTGNELGIEIKFDAEKTTEEAKNVITNTKETLSNLPEEEQPQIPMAVKADEEQIKGEVSLVKNTIDNIPEEEKAKVDVGAKVNEEDLTQIPNDIKSKTTEINEELSQEENKLKIGATLNTEEFDSGLDTMKETIGIKGEEITESMTNVGTNAVNALNATMLNGNETYIATLTENANTIKTTFEDAGTGLGISGDNSSVFEAYGLAVINGFKIGVERNKQISLDAVSIWVKDIMRAFVGNDVEGINYNVWFEYAHQVMLGFAEGITHWSYLAKEAISRWVSEMMAEFEEDMEIESPSKVFADYGYYTVAGFNKGIEDNQSTTTTIIKDWVGDIEKQMKAIENFNIDMSNTIKGLDNLTARVNTQVDMSGFYGELEKAQTAGMNTSLNSYAENRQAIEVNIPNITLEVDSREIARANYKGQKQLGYQIKK